MSLLVIVNLALWVPPAPAHGPCGDVCLEPDSGPAGTRVTTENLEGVLAVWNPRPNTLSLGLPGMSDNCDVRCARALPIYHLDLPTEILAESDERAQLAFRVPAVPPGEYLIVVYDGSENGFHYTWETFTVTRASLQPEAGVPSRDTDGIPFLGVGAGLLLGLALGWFGRARVSGTRRR